MLSIYIYTLEVCPCNATEKVQTCNLKFKNYTSSNIKFKNYIYYI